MTQVAGWYPDPTGGPTNRWWNGEAWGPETSRSCTQCLGVVPVEAVACRHCGYNEKAAEIATGTRRAWSVVLLAAVGIVVFLAMLAVLNGSV